MMIVMKTNLPLKVSFYTRYGKESKVEQSPVLLRVSYAGTRMVFGQVPIEVPPGTLVKSRVPDSLPNHKALNDELEELEQNLLYLAKDLHKRGALSLETLHVVSVMKIRRDRKYNPHRRQLQADR